MKKVETDIKNILLSKCDKQEAEDIFNEIMDKIGSIKLRKTSPRKKDKNAPKNAQNAYMFFCNTNRATFKEKHPEMNATTVVQQMSKIWRELSDEEKGPYNKMAEKDKLRYSKAMEAYKAEKEESPSDVSDKEAKTKTKPKTSSRAVPVKEKKTQEKEKKTSTKKQADESKSKTKSNSDAKSKTTIPKNPPVAAIRDEDDDDEDFDDEEPTEE